MTKIQKYVGLDVHKDTISIAVAEGGAMRQPTSLGTVPHDVPRLLKRLREQAEPQHVHCAYEAGPTGFGLCRRLRAEGMYCIVVAPSKLPRQPGNRVKTDRRDALELARYLRSGDLVGIYLPGEGVEALRDLVRARDDNNRALQRARHQLSKFLLRHDRRWDGRSSWTHLHFDWICGQRFNFEAQRRVLDDYVHEVRRLKERIERLTSSVDELAETIEERPLYKALQAFRGISVVTAATVVAEIGNLRRFPHPRNFMGYLGLVPSEYSSGPAVRRGTITKAGNTHVRRVLIEAAWNYRYRSAVTKIIERRSREVAPRVKDIAWKAQHRLNKRYRRMMGRGKSKGRTIVAIARELAGFIWAVGQEEQLLITNQN